MPFDIPVRRNTAAGSALLAVNIFQFLLLPGLAALRGHGWLLLIAPAALTSNTLWYLMHEAFHRSLHPDPRANDAWGRVLSVAFGAPYEVVRFGHLMHHRFNGALIDRPDLYDSNRTGRLRACLGYYTQLLGGLYFSEFCSFALFLGGRRLIARLLDGYFDSADPAEREMGRLAKRTFLAPDVVSRMRLDGLACYGLLAVSFGLYARAGLWFVPLVILGLRGFFVSIANNVPHYAQPTDDVLHGLSVRMSPRLTALMLNFNHHHTHHYMPTAPWTELPRLHAERGERFDMHWLDATLIQLEGPIALRDLGKREE